jgi:hypothetical protein
LWPQEAETANAQLIANLRLFSLEVQGGADPQAEGTGRSGQDEDEGDGGGEDLTALQAELSKQVLCCGRYDLILGCRSSGRCLRVAALHFVVYATDHVEISLAASTS